MAQLPGLLRMDKESVQYMTDNQGRFLFVVRDAKRILLVQNCVLDAYHQRAQVLHKLVAELPDAAVVEGWYSQVSAITNGMQSCGGLTNRGCMSALRIVFLDRLTD